MSRRQGTVECPSCHAWFKGRRGLTIHQQRNYPACQPNRQIHQGAALPVVDNSRVTKNNGSSRPHNNDTASTAVSSRIMTSLEEKVDSEDEWANYNCNNSVQSENVAAFEESQEHDDSDDTSSSAEMMDINHDTLNTNNVPQDSHTRPPETQHELNNNGNMETSGVDISADNLIGDDTNVANNNSPDETLLQEYEEYILERARNDVDSYTTNEKVQVDLLRVLKELKAPLKTFKEVLDWASRAASAGYNFTRAQPSRATVLNRLYQRQNMKHLLPQTKKLQLPHCKKTIDVIYFDAKAVFASMLACPLLNKDENFMFHNNDPFSPPPNPCNYVGDLNTSLGYKATHETLIQNPNEDVLLPCILSMDKTQCDTYGRLSMEPITISYGLMKRQIRNSPLAMRVLGYINHEPLHAKDSNEAVDPNPNAMFHDNEIVHNTPCLAIPGGSSEKSCRKLNDYHAQIYFILQQSGFLNLQHRGIRWNLRYRDSVIPITLQLYVPFIIGDTEGHDRLCGHYNSRGNGVKQLCRACHCPTEHSGYSKASYPYRRQNQIKSLVEQQQMDLLQQMSQHYLLNGFRDLRFGCHNTRGIFGACPGELLHLIQIGWFKYTMEAFVSQAGDKSSAIGQYDRLCAEIGFLMKRRSERDLPRTSFPKGFTSGSHLMANELPGCLLVMLLAFHTHRYGEIFANRRKYKQERGLGNKEHISDWVLLLTTLLQWHEWLKQDTISKTNIRRFRTAVRWIIRQFKFIAPRTSGMKHNTVKMHLVLHIAEDIVNHGVPQNFNSSFTESAHIPIAKATSRNTQKRVGTFTQQAAQRYIENIAIDLAWNDSIGQFRDVTINQQEGCEGRRYTVAVDPTTGQMHHQWNRRRINTHILQQNIDGQNVMNRNVNLPIHVMRVLEEHCVNAIPGQRLYGFTEYHDTESGQKYRAHPEYMGEPWYDMVMINWHGVDGLLPAQIYTFVDLTAMPPGSNFRIEATGQVITAGKYAIVESFSKYNHPQGNDDDPNSLIPETDDNSMIGRYTKDIEAGEMFPTLYLVNVSSISGPAVGIPNKRKQLPQARNRPVIQDMWQEYLFINSCRTDWPAHWDAFMAAHFDRAGATETEETDDH
jgi:Plavaka transposase